MRRCGPNLPVVFYSLDIFDRISEKMIAHEEHEPKRTPPTGAEKLVKELTATAEEPMEDFQKKIGKLRAQFNPVNTEIAIRKLLFLARNNGDEQAKQQLMPIVREFIQTVVIAKLSGRQPAALAVHGHTLLILAAMQAATIMEERLKAMHSLDYEGRLRAGEIETEQKRKKLLGAFAEELERKNLERGNLRLLFGCGGRI